MCSHTNTCNTTHLFGGAKCYLSGTLSIAAQKKTPLASGPLFVRLELKCYLSGTLSIAAQKKESPSGPLFVRLELKRSTSH